MGWTYDTYMVSEEWEGRCALYFRHHAKRCVPCGSESDIELHHRTHANLGNEPDGDLVAMCAKCHAELHRAAQTHPLKALSMSLATLRYLAWASRKEKSRKKRLGNTTLKANTRCDS